MTGLQALGLCMSVLLCAGMIAWLFYILVLHAIESTQQKKDRASLDEIRCFRCPKCSRVVKIVQRHADGSWLCRWCKP